MHIAWIKVAKRLGVSILALLLVVCLALVAVFTMPAARGFVLQRGLAFANENTDYRIALASAERLDPWGVELRGLSVHDVKNTFSIEVGALSLRLSPLALLQSELRVRSLSIRGVRGYFHNTSSAEKDPAADDVGASEDEGGLRVHVHALSVQDLAVVTSGVGPVASVQVRALEAWGEWSDRPWVFLSKADLQVMSDRGALLQLSTRESRWDPDRGASVVLEGTLADAPLRLSAAIKSVQEGEPWPRGNLRLDVAQLSPEAWASLGLEDVPLGAPLTLTLSATSRGASGEADLAFSVRAARVKLHAELLQDLIALRLDAAVPDLSHVSSVLPKLDLSGWLTARSHDPHDRTRWVLAWHDIVASDKAWPSGELVGQLDLPMLRIQSLTLDELGDGLVVSGAWNTESSQGGVDLVAEELVLSRWTGPGPKPMRGRLNGHLRFEMDATGISGGGKLRAVDLNVAGFVMGAGKANVAISGTATRPQLALKADAFDLTVSDLRIRRAEARLDANLDQAQAKLAIHGPDGWLRTEARVTGLEEDTAELSLTAEAMLRTTPLTVSMQARRTHASKHTKVVLQARSGPQELSATATFEDDERGRAKLALSNLTLPGAPPIDGTLEASGSLVTGAFQARLNAWCENKAATLAADLQLEVPKTRNGTLDYARARQQTHVGAHVPIALLTASAGKRFAGLRGVVDLAADLAGTVQQPEGDAAMAAQVSLVAQPDLPPESLSVSLHADPSGARASVRVVDLQGELLTLQGAIDWQARGMEATLRELTTRALPAVRVQARLAERRLDTMQGVVAYLSGIDDLSLPIQVGGDVGLNVVDGVVDGSVRARALLRGDKLDARCALATQAAMSLSVDVTRGEVKARLDAHTAQGGTLAVTADTRLLVGTPLDRLLKEVELHAQGREISLASLPGLCDLEGGKLAFELQGKGLGLDPTQAAVSVHISDLRAQGGSPVSVELAGRKQGDTIRAEGTFHAESKQAGSFQLQVPLTPGDVPRIAMDRPVSGSLRLTHLPLGPFLSFGDTLARPRGTITGQIRLSGTLDEPQPEGFVTLHEVAFSLASIAQPLRGINGKISLRGRTLRIQGMTARDRDGKLRLDGVASLKKSGEGDLDVTVQLDEFPLRRQGEILGELTTRIRARAAMDAQMRVKTDVTVDGGRLWLTGERGRRVQSLAKHSEVRFVDEPQEKVEIQKTKLSVSLASLQAKTQRAFWVMHKDFSVQVSLDVALTHDKGFELVGAANLVRGELQLLGKNFRIQKGAIRFTGDFPPDPELELHAVYKPPAGEELRVDVTGRASGPVLAFSGAATNAGEAVAVLSGSNRAGAASEAQTDARNFAAGLTAGLLSMTVREEYGDWVPIVSVENDETGAPARGRAAFDASELIPKFLRGVARGAYVEGIVGSSGQSGGSVGLGARIEVILPHDFVTSAGYGPGSTWGTDLAWAP